MLRRFKASKEDIFTTRGKKSGFLNFAICIVPSR